MSKLTEVLRLTREANEFARAGDWTQVVQIEAQRRPLLREVFVDRTTGPQDDERSIREILASDRELIELARAQRAEAAGNALASKRNKQAIHQYSSNGARG